MSDSRGSTLQALTTNLLNLRSIFQLVIRKQFKLPWNLALWKMVRQKRDVSASLIWQVLRDKWGRGGHRSMFGVCGSQDHKRKGRYNCPACPAYLPELLWGSWPGGPSHMFVLPLAKAWKTQFLTQSQLFLLTSKSFNQSMVQQDLKQT